MKKINKRNLFLLLFMVLMVAFTSSCSKHTQQASIVINDPYSLLHKDLKDSLAVQHPILRTRIEAIKELPFGSEVAILDSIPIPQTLNSAIFSTALAKSTFLILKLPLL